MNWPTRAEFAQVRRAFPTAAAALFLLALLFPMWVINVTAVQYPGEILQLRLYAFPHIAGDYWEMAELNQYIGFYYPDPVYWQPNYEVHPRAVDVPEWSLAPVAFVAVAATGLFVAVAPTIEKLKRGLKWQIVGTVTVFTVMLVDIQYRLFQTGHNLDPGAPVVGVDPFTPPIWGRYEVANITSYSRFGTGVYLAMAAIGLLVISYYYRDSEADIRQLPAQLRARLASTRRRLSRGVESDDDQVTPSRNEL